MKNNIMTFGDTHFLQLIGTAMGTPAAVMLANIYFGFQEKNTIIRKYQRNLKRLQKHVRLIDDIFRIWLGGTDEEWEQMKCD